LGGNPNSAYLHVKTSGVQLNGNTVFKKYSDYNNISNKNDDTINFTTIVNIPQKNNTNEDISFIQPDMRSQECEDKSQHKFEKLSLNSYKKIKSKDNDELKYAVAKQPVSVGIVGSDLLEYESGIVDQNSCKDNTALDHSVLIVGYDYDEAKGKEYWIVKNSWGPKWGVDGYMYMERQKGESQGTCGIAIEATYPVLDKIPRK